MSYPSDIHKYENYLVDALQDEYIPTIDHSAYYTILAGLRLRVFEGIVTSFLDHQQINYQRTERWNGKGLFNKLIHIQNVITGTVTTNAQQINALIGILHRPRNEILHGNFDFKITKDIWVELNRFLYLIENHFDLLVDGQTNQINYTGSNATSLKFRISTLLSP